MDIRNNIRIKLDDSSVIDVYAFEGSDGVPVVQVDTVNVERLRVNLNDGAIWDGGDEEVSPIVRIQRIMSGNEWTPDTLDAIAEVLRTEGFDVEDVA